MALLFPNEMSQWLILNNTIIQRTRLRFALSIMKHNLHQNNYTVHP